MKRMVCVWLPDWSVDVMRRRKRLSNETIVLLVIAGLEDEVVRCCQKACQLGIVPGMSVSHARTLIGDRDKELFVNTLDERQDALAMVRLARWAKRYSPRVMIDQSPSCGEGLILDVTGCTHLFGGMSVMVEQIATSLERFCVRSFVGCAGTIGCAWAASRYKGGQCVEPGGERSFLSSCPVTSLRLDLTCVASLHEVGLYDIGMLWGIPKAELADRFGLTLVRRLDQALGIGAEVVTWLDDDALPYVSQRFSGPVSSLETMSCVVHNLCKELSCVLHERSRGAVRLLLLCLGSDELEIRRELCVSQPVCDGEHWWSLLRLELEALEFFYKENNFGGGSGGVEEIIIQVLSWELMAYEQGAFLEKKSLVGGADGFGSSCISGSLLKR